MASQCNVRKASYYVYSCKMRRQSGANVLCVLMVITCYRVWPCGQLNARSSVSLTVIVSCDWSAFAGVEIREGWRIRHHALKTSVGELCGHPQHSFPKHKINCGK